MIRNKILAILFILLAFSGKLLAQDLMDMLKDEAPKTDYTYATFKTTRLVLGQSIESPAKGTLQSVIEHTFGPVNSGAYNLWGLDAANMRLGFEYGICNRLGIGIGRSSFEKTFDGSAKIKILRQSSGEKNMPIALSFYGAAYLKSQHWEDPSRTNYFSSRMSYIAQLLIARKFSNSLSIQITPTYVHKNLVPYRTDYNDQISVGIGGRYKVSQRTSVNVEYYYQIPGFINSYFNSTTKEITKYANSLSVGIDLETGGHVFQIRLTNSQHMFDRAFINETTDRWKDGGIALGFTINRVFTIVKPALLEK
jgi:hypothetical protein